MMGSSSSFWTVVSMCPSRVDAERLRHLPRGQLGRVSLAERRGGRGVVRRGPGDSATWSSEVCNDISAFM